MNLLAFGSLLLWTGLAVAGAAGLVFPSVRIVGVSPSDTSSDQRAGVTVETVALKNADSQVGENGLDAPEHSASAEPAALLRTDLAAQNAALGLRSVSDLHAAILSLNEGADSGLVSGPHAIISNCIAGVVVIAKALVTNAVPRRNVFTAIGPGEFGVIKISVGVEICGPVVTVPVPVRTDQNNIAVLGLILREVHSGILSPAARSSARAGLRSVNPTNEVSI